MQLVDKKAVRLFQETSYRSPRLRNLVGLDRIEDCSDNNVLQGNPFFVCLYHVLFHEQGDSRGQLRSDIKGDAAPVRVHFLQKLTPFEVCYVGTAEFLLVDAHWYYMKLQKEHGGAQALCIVWTSTHR
jgi:hypothetical protein